MLKPVGLSESIQSDFGFSFAFLDLLCSDWFESERIDQMDSNWNPHLESNGKTSATGSSYTSLVSMRFSPLCDPKCKCLNDANIIEMQTGFMSEIEGEKAFWETMWKSTDGIAICFALVSRWRSQLRLELQKHWICLGFALLYLHLSTLLSLFMFMSDEFHSQIRRLTLRRKNRKRANLQAKIESQSSLKGSCKHKICFPWISEDFGMVGSSSFETHLNSSGSSSN